jgi:hypothetical protein
VIVVQDEEVSLEDTKTSSSTFETRFSQTYQSIVYLFSHLSKT